MAQSTIGSGTGKGSTSKGGDLNSLRPAWRFFMDNAGYVAGARAQGALELARAEQEGKRRGLSFSWYSDGLSDDPNHEACFCYGTDGACLASLGGADRPDGDYRRV